MDSGASQATVHGVTKSLKQLGTHPHILNKVIKSWERALFAKDFELLIVIYLISGFSASSRMLSHDSNQDVKYRGRFGRNL